MITYLKALFKELFTLPDPYKGYTIDDVKQMPKWSEPAYRPDHRNIKHPDDDITPPQICPMNEGDMLCIHRTATTAEVLLGAELLGYDHTMDVCEPCPYQADYDHYSVEKKSD